MITILPIVLIICWYSWYWQYDTFDIANFLYYKPSTSEKSILRFRDLKPSFKNAYSVYHFTPTLAERCFRNKTNKDHRYYHVMPDPICNAMPTDKINSINYIVKLIILNIPHVPTLPITTVFSPCPLLYISKSWQ